MKTASCTQLASHDDYKVARLAAIARCDTIHGGARATVIARHCSRWDAQSIVADVYSRSTGKWSAEYEAWECPECGTAHLGQEAALRCCAQH